jgi:hypothetical protein
MCPGFDGPHTYTKDDSACPDCYIAGSVSAFAKEHQALTKERDELRAMLRRLIANVKRHYVLSYDC